MIEAFLVADSNGIPVYKAHFGNWEFDDTLLLGFFAALKTFAQTLTVTEKMDKHGRFSPQNSSTSSEIRCIHLGPHLLTFDQVTFDHLGTIDVLVMSRFIDPATAQAFLEEITEHFMIYRDDYYAKYPERLEAIKQGFHPKFTGFKPQLIKLINRFDRKDTVEMDVHVSIPTDLYEMVADLFETDNEIADLYGKSKRLVLDQLLNEYANKKLEADFLKKFGKKKWFNPFS
ncbi:MAG: hypothetical protein ACTSWW_06350 [Promethearchaeota archaeon]